MIVETTVGVVVTAAAVEVKKKKVELEREILREYALHLEALGYPDEGFSKFFSTLGHNSSSCATCTRAIVVLRPSEPWRGWAL